MRYRFLLVLILFFVLAIPALAQEKTFYEKALVLDSQEKSRAMVESDPGYDPESQGVITYQEIKIRILSGKYKGEEKILENSIVLNPFSLEIGKGDKIIIYLQELEEGLDVQIHDYYRLPQLIWLAAIFLILMVLIGKMKGLRAVVSLVISIFLIFKVFIPLVLKNVSPIWLALIVCAAIAIITLLIIAGNQKKTWAAIFGTIGGLAAAAVLAIFFGNLSRLNGLSSEEARILMASFPLNFKGILFSGMIIAALGAVMDVAISIASGMAEIKKADPIISFKKLTASGLEIGRDIIGTMSNTLIFAYVGASLFILLLFTQYGESYLKFFNFDFVAEEIIGAVAGSIGLVLTVPITAIIAGYLETKR